MRPSARSTLVSVVSQENSNDDDDNDGDEEDKDDDATTIRVDANIKN